MIHYVSISTILGVLEVGSSSETPSSELSQLNNFLCAFRSCTMVGLSISNFELRLSLLLVYHFRSGNYLQSPLGLHVKLANFNILKNLNSPLVCTYLRGGGGGIKALLVHEVLNALPFSLVPLSGGVMSPRFLQRATDTLELGDLGGT